MRLSRTIGSLLFALVATLAGAQSWSEAYERGITAINAEQYAKARTAFKQAASIRAEDYSKSTVLPGAVTDPKKWRNGAPYSPNFAAAYSAYKLAKQTKDDAQRNSLLNTAVSEFELLLAKRQISPETIYFLSSCYDDLREIGKNQRLQENYSDPKQIVWRVDTDIISPEERVAALSARTIAAKTAPPTKVETASQTKSLPSANKPTTQVEERKPVPAQPPIAKPVETITPAVAIQPVVPVQPSEKPQPKAETKTAPNPAAEPVAKPKNPTIDDGRPKTAPTPVEQAPDPLAKDPSKFALIIGNKTTRLPDGEMPFAETDATLVRERLIQHAGYIEDNVELVIDGTAEQMSASVKNLANRIGEDNAVVIFFAGTGVNLDGKDYLAGVDSTLATDPSTMLAKWDLYRPFVERGARIFAFYEVNRPIIAGRYFGWETPDVGAISQMQATRPGHKVFSIVRGGRETGLFGYAIGEVLASFQSNSIPIKEFGWRVFDTMKKGGVSGSGGGSVQTPTLPDTKYMSDRSPF